MLSKCSNPSCSTTFLHLNEGRLYCFETNRTSRSASVRQAEYFWLCDRCCSAMTLRVHHGAEVVPVLRKDQAYRHRFLGITNLHDGINN